MNINRRYLLLLVAGLVSGISGCSGSDSSSARDNEEITVPLLGIEGGGLQGIEGGGIISKFGANFSTVTVNGKDYDTTGPALVVTIDNMTANISDLKVGNVVFLSAGVVTNGGLPVLASIEQQTDIDGPVSTGSIDLVAGTFVVLGQLIQVNSATAFDENISPPTLEGLSDGDFLEVSGLISGDGRIVASRIEKDDSPDELEVFGAVMNLDTVNFRFSIGQLIVDYSSAELEGFANNEIMNGDLIDAEGTMLGSADELIATEVENKNPEFNGEDGNEGEVEGLVTRFVSVTDFDVAGYSITSNSETEFERGTSSDLILGAQVKVEGKINAAGALLAKKVEFTADESESMGERTPYF